MTETVFKFLGKFYHKISVKMSFLYFSWLALCKKCLSGKILVLELWIKKVLTNNIAWFSKFNIFLQWFFGWWCNTMRLKGQENCQKLLLLTICKYFIICTFRKPMSFIVRTSSGASWWWCIELVKLSLTQNSPHPGRLRGDSFIRPWRTLNFYLPQGD